MTPPVSLALLHVFVYCGIILRNVITSLLRNVQHFDTQKHDVHLVQCTCSDGFAVETQKDDITAAAPSVHVQVAYPTRAPLPNHSHFHHRAYLTMVG